MRLIGFIFSVYILYLVSLPCVDGDLHSCKVSHEQSTENNTPSEHTDTCSPFCVCSCCNVQVVLNAFIFETSPSLVYQIVHSGNFEGNEFLFAAFVWQPPKVG
ncbi:MAG: hypothetical protein HC905_31910 [Bacteroidales bacterium]|nr:hypothetical protein [Bacteroidales bacterium]